LFKGKAGGRIGVWTGREDCAAVASVLGAASALVAGCVDDEEMFEAGSALFGLTSAVRGCADGAE